TGSYTFVPNNQTINELTAPTTDNSFILTVSDGTTSTQLPLSITLDGVNDAPTLQPVPGQTITDTRLNTFTAGTGTLAGADVDRPAQTLTYGIAGGTTDNSLSGYNQSLTGTYGTLFVNTATGAYTFVPNGSAIKALPATTTTENFTFTVSDGSLSAQQTFTVTLNGADDAPVVTDTAGTTSWAEAAGNGPNPAVVIDGGVTVTDPDNPTLASATVSITSGFVAGEDVLAFTPGAAFGNIIATYNPNTGVLSLTSPHPSAPPPPWTPPP